MGSCDFMNRLLQGPTIPARHRRNIVAVLCMWIAAACGPAVPRCGTPFRVGALPNVVRESSGVDASRRRSGALWTHNDSGSRPELYAVDTAGHALGRVRVRGATSLDWEDVATAPCSPAGGSCLYIGDIGNNHRNRDTATVYRLPEPEPEDSVTALAEHLPVRYPDGSWDAEALFVLPGPQIYIVTKGVRHPVTVYRYPPPLRPGRRVTLQEVQRLTADAVALPDQVTAAVATPDGRWVAMRTYTTLRFYQVRGERLQAVGDSMGVDLSALAEPQGEGLGYAGNGVFYLTSEQGLDTVAALSRIRCRLP